MRSSEWSGQALDVLRRDGADFRIAGETRGDAGADPRRAFAQQELARGRGDAIGVQRFAATVIEHARLRRRNQRRDLLRDEGIVHVAVARIDVDRMRTVPEREPAGAHARHSASSGPCGPNAGSVNGQRHLADGGDRLGVLGLGAAAEIVFAARRIGADDHEVAAVLEALMPGAGRQNDDVAGRDVDLCAVARRRSAPWRGRGRCPSPRGSSNDSARKGKCRCATCRPSRCRQRSSRSAVPGRASRRDRCRRDKE